MQNKIINLGLVAEIAEALKELKEVMVFVGGAMISLYTDDPAAGEIRPTKDIDMTIKLSYTFSEWTRIQERLLVLGFSPDPTGHSICSYKYRDISIDIMPSTASPLGATNKWFKVGFGNLKTVFIEESEIQILSAPCFLATKFEAFHNRGEDYRWSHDFEDIIYVLDNRLDIVEEIVKDDNQVKEFLKLELEKVINHPSSEEILSCHIHPLIQTDRLPILKAKIEQILV